MFFLVSSRMNKHVIGAPIHRGPEEYVRLGSDEQGFSLKGSRFSLKGSHSRNYYNKNFSYRKTCVFVTANILNYLLG